LPLVFFSVSRPSLVFFLKNFEKSENWENLIENQAKMDGLLVFDISNDLIYRFLNEPMKKKLHKLSVEMKLIEVSDNFHYFST
jgi:hypothetical protein